MNFIQLGNMQLATYADTDAHNCTDFYGRCGHTCLKTLENAVIVADCSKHGQMCCIPKIDADAIPKGWPM